MKIITLLIALFTLPTYATDIFIEPGIFTDMFDGETVTYDDGTKEYEGTLRNSDLSYAIKFGLHIGKWEFGLESEIYNFSAHFKGKGNNANFAKDIQVTYNSVFVGYEFYPKNIFYLSISNTPYLYTDNESYEDHASIFSLEYSYHIKDWVSVNVKVENSSHLVNKGSSPEKSFSYRDLILVGFSFPLTSKDHSF